LQEEAMQYRVLGPLEVRDDGRSVPLAGAKQRALLALLPKRRRVAAAGSDRLLRRD
jgi:DNA-binding SARP family transcriptional activator